MQETIVKIWRQYPSHPVCHVETDMQLPVIRRSVHNHDSHLHPRLAIWILVLMYTFIGNLQVIKKPCQLLMWASRLTSRDSVARHQNAPVLFSSGPLFRVLSVCSSYIQYCSVVGLPNTITISSTAGASTRLTVGHRIFWNRSRTGWMAPQPIVCSRAATMQLMTGSQPGIASCVLVLPPCSKVGLSGRWAARTLRAVLPHY